MPKINANKKTAVVVCPGRGSYAKAELGYLSRSGHHVAHLIKEIDEARSKLGLPTVTNLDLAERFSIATHTPGEHASDLIYACSLSDFFAIDRDRFEIVAVCGNSMGWYTALALSGGLTAGGDFQLIHTMGAMMQGGVVGGQLIYPVCDENWLFDETKGVDLANALDEVSREPGAEAYVSIRFGGYRVIGGNEVALKRLKERLPPLEDGKYPMVLVNHAAFHTPLLKDVSERALSQIGSSWFQAPEVPLIDGRGKIWQPWATEVEDLRRYTLTTQVTTTYDFTKSLQVAMKEFAPDCLILLGPGSGLGGAVGQTMIADGWHGIQSKEEFVANQQVQALPYVIAMGRPEQRGLVLQ